MANGPSKQDLEMYWQSSRQYFDELAQYYKTADPAYYKEFIEPFYSNPFRSSYNQSGTKSSGGGGKFVIIIFALLLLLGVGGASIFLFMSSDSITKKIENLGSDRKTTENTRTTEKETTEEKTIEPSEEVEPDDPSELSGEDNFIIGAKYIGEKKYDKAAYHLNRIKPGDKRYKEAQQLLESIKFLKKYDK
ncbi:MAG: hypothetical protein ABI543_10630 [Ignavibacteria bacterium]